METCFDLRVLVPKALSEEEALALLTYFHAIIIAAVAEFHPGTTAIVDSDD